MSTETPSTRPTSATPPHIVTREFNAPRDLLWEVNTRPEHMAKWLAPAGFTTWVKTFELHVGGMNHYRQTSADGATIMWGKAIHLEIEPKDRIVTVHCFSDENGGVSAHPMAPAWPKWMHSVFTFEALAAQRSRLTITWTPVEGSSEEELAMFDNAREGMNGGWKGTLDNLENYLSTQKP